MKHNVDLTEHFDFSVRSQLVSLGNISITTGASVDPRQELVLTGNAEERWNKKLSMSFCVPDNTCDRCGTTIPWKFLRQSSLCDRCEEEITEERLWWQRSCSSDGRAADL